MSVPKPDPMRTIFALEAIFTALDWIDDAGLKKVVPEMLDETRVGLVLAGKLLCQEVTEMRPDR